MSSKEIKTTLKEAREAVKNRKFSDAIKLCNKVLKEQNDNYMALLLLGASYQDSDKKEAAAYLRRAVTCTNEPLVALQGLSSCADATELPDICKQLLILTPDKYLELHGKLLGVVAQGILQPVLRILETEIECEDESRRLSAYECLGKIVSQNLELEKTEDVLVAKVLEREILKNEDLYQRDKFRRYLKLLQTGKRFDRLATVAAAMHERFPYDIFPLEWICKLYSEGIVAVEKLPELLTYDISTYIERAVTVAPNSAAALLAKGKMHFSAGQLTEARSALQRANEVQPLWGPCMELLAEIYYRQKAYGLAENLYRTMKVSNRNLAIALLEDESQEKLREADQHFATLYEKDQSIELLFSWCKTKLLLGDATAAEKIFDQLKTIAGIERERLDYLLALREKLNSNVERQIELLSPHEGNSYCLLELSKVLSTVEGKREESFFAALKATKLDPNNSLCYYWLGKLYLEQNDTLRAQKCLEKSIHLSPASRNAVILLSGLYRRNGEWTSNATLLSTTFALCSGAAWAQLQLGLHYLGRQEFDDAIGAFRTVLRYEVDNATAWESLADAYLGRGSYSSAMKVFEKITERNPDNPYPVLQLGNIKNAVKLYREALVLFEQLLAQHANYFPAIKGIADSHMGLCFQRLGQRRIGSSRDHAQLCVEYLSKAIKMKPNFICLWHQLGKVLDAVALFPAIHSHLLVEGSLAGSDTYQCALLKDRQLAELAGRCYGRIVKQNPENSIFWYELSKNYFNRARMIPSKRDLDNDPQHIDRPEQLKLLTMARDIAKHAIKLNPSRWQNWNLLGVICATKEVNNLALAQHCFVEAVTADRKTTAVAWSNLGVLYQANGQLGLANKAFTRAQQIDPTFINAWIGQAIIAETVGLMDEAMDLFRHCMQLGYHRESSLGYAHWVCMIVNEDNYEQNGRYRFAVEDMAALPVSHDAISWHCADLAERATMPALRFLGNISSRLGLWRTATEAYQRALRVHGPDESLKDEIRCDLGHCLMKQQRYAEAVECYESMRGKAFYRASVGRAQSYFRAAQYEQSYAEYEQGLNYLAQTDMEKAYVLIAMSAMVYAFQGEADAKTILFQCITLPEPPVEALFSACALGLLHKDNELTELVVQELRKYENDPVHGHHVTFLVSEFYWQNSQQSKCRAYLLSQLHRYPNRPKLFQILAMALIKRFRTPKANLHLACSVAQGAVALDLADRRNRTRSEDAARWMAVASEAVSSQDERKCRILAQKALHLDPTCREAWGAFQRIVNQARA